MRGRVKGLTGIVQKRDGINILLYMRWDSWQSAVLSDGRYVTPPAYLIYPLILRRQGLAMNPRTFTPEVLLTVARIVQLPDANAEKQLAVRQLLRPGAAQMSFSFGLAENEDEEEEGDEEVHEWNDALTAGWRIIE